jgi:hypothetical protein
LHGCGGLGQIDFDLLVVQLSFAQHLAEFLPCGGILGLGWLCLETESRWARRWQQGIEDAFLGSVLCAHLHFFHLAFADLLDGHLHQVADDGVDVLADIADLGELGGFHLDEG